MNSPLLKEDDLAAAASPLIIYACLAGVCSFFMLIIALSFWSSDTFIALSVIIPLMIALVLAILAKGIRARKAWAWLPSAAFSVLFFTVFPIGTFISYFSLRALWKCRRAFYPFAATENE